MNNPSFEDKKILNEACLDGMLSVLCKSDEEYYKEYLEIMAQTQRDQAFDLQPTELANEDHQVSQLPEVDFEGQEDE